MIGPDHAVLAPEQVVEEGAVALLQPGGSDTIYFNAPTQPGVYEYVCTFPGHWQVMWGQLVVTKDVDAYLAKHPQAPTLASDPHAHHSFE